MINFPYNTQPPIKCIAGAISLEVKQPGLEADHSSPISAGVKTVELYLHSFIYLQCI
jgi:hypothetical protein